MNKLVLRGPACSRVGLSWPLLLPLLPLLPFLPLLMPARLRSHVPSTLPAA